MASFTQLLNAAFAAQDKMPRTRECYSFWLRKAYEFIQRPASSWQGDDVEQFIVWLDGDAARGVSPLDAGRNLAIALA